jgi:hypothetical protein
MVKIDEYGNLQCPVCEDIYLHQVATRVVFREEDSNGVEHRINHFGHQAVPLDECHIPGRRDVLEIDFGCEECGDIVGIRKIPVVAGVGGGRLKTLVIKQAKGLTVMDWK